MSVAMPVVMQIMQSDSALQDINSLLLVRKGAVLLNCKGIPKDLEERIIAFLIPYFTELQGQYEDSNEWYRYAKVFLVQQLDQKFHFSTFTLFSGIKQPTLLIEEEKPLRESLEETDPLVEIKKALKPLEGARISSEKPDIGKTFFELECRWKNEIDARALYFQDVYKKHVIVSALGLEWGIDFPMPSYELYKQLSLSSEKTGASQFYVLLNFIAQTLKEHHKDVYHIDVDRTKVDTFLLEIALKQKISVKERHFLCMKLESILETWRSLNPLKPIPVTPLEALQNVLQDKADKTHLPYKALSVIVSRVCMNLFREHYLFNVLRLFRKIDNEEERLNTVWLAVIVAGVSALSLCCLVVNLLDAAAFRQSPFENKMLLRLSVITFIAKIVLDNVAAFYILSKTKCKFQSFTEKCTQVLRCLYIKPTQRALAPWRHRFESAKWLANRESLLAELKDVMSRIQRYRRAHP